ncbi:hypothetical protein P2G88_07375 [Aliiglaciecola sp. CAU 1673]|uniref:hypothetical protein n=1 Tax=Aliiglaciecola sp. CAU 1673 TaxID=3032595 RepID=UPI0023DA2704|nr:hypothetical protein [Aliiglaciecola sp. CAU 1673]MDF2178071.1 hypothetical protein [Aliiglaciecola sp. CAU 1673]
MLSKFRSVTLMALLIFTCLAQAKDDDGAFALKGIGTATCNRYIDAAANEKPELLQIAGYVTGYISAYNELSEDTFDLLPWQQMDTLMLLMLQQCRQNPQLTIGMAVSQLARYFSATKLAQQSAMQEITSGGSTFYLYPQVLEQLTKALRERGYASGDLVADLNRFKQENQIKGEHPFAQLVILKLLYSKDPA